MRAAQAYQWQSEDYRQLILVLVVGTQQDNDGDQENNGSPDNDGNSLT